VGWLFVFVIPTVESAKEVAKAMDKRRTQKGSAQATLADMRKHERESFLTGIEEYDPPENSSNRMFPKEIRDKRHIALEC
jgi:hypothetical protein